jgi:hypothetical protein
MAQDRIANCSPGFHAMIPSVQTNIMTHNPNGRVLYTGPSMLDGAPIVVIATGFDESSANAKTGGMIQTWILRQDIPPHHAFKSAEGESVCGKCPHKINGTCYVRWYQAPLAVWNCWHHGKGYAQAQPSDFDGVQLRLGAAGDPAAVPAWIWASILPRVAGHTGYTHQWREPFAAHLRGVVQASCDSIADLDEARAAGWRTFTVLPVGMDDPASTVHCAASVERGAKTSCAKCGLCDGARADVVITAHGVKAGKVAW